MKQFKFLFLLILFSCNSSNESKLFVDDEVYQKELFAIEDYNGSERFSSGKYNSLISSLKKKNSLKILSNEAMASLTDLLMDVHANLLTAKVTNLCLEETSFHESKVKALKEEVNQLQELKERLDKAALLIKDYETIASLFRQIPYYSRNREYSSQTTNYYIKEVEEYRFKEVFNRNKEINSKADELGQLLNEHRVADENFEIATEDVYLCDCNASSGIINFRDFKFYSYKCRFKTLKATFEDVFGEGGIDYGSTTAVEKAINKANDMEDKLNELEDSLKKSSLEVELSLLRKGISTKKHELNNRLLELKSS